MAERKTERLTLRVAPSIKAALEALAEQDCRSVAETIAWLALQEQRRREGETS